MKFLGRFDRDSEVDPHGTRNPLLLFACSKELFMTSFRHATSDQVPSMLQNNLGIADEGSIVPRSPVWDAAM